MSLPFVSVLVLNYNGAHFLLDCLPALRQQNYPPALYEVVVVDNASKDDSAELVRRSFPWVRWRPNPDNWGFARGNNVAIRGTAGQYVALLNNDTVVDRNWLRALAEAAEADLRVGICTSKIVLRFRQVELEIESPGGRVQVFQVDAGNPLGVVQYLDGFGKWEGARPERFRWAHGRAILGVPITSEERNQTHGPAGLRVRICLAAPESVPVQVRVNGHHLAEWRTASAPRWYEAMIPPEDLVGAANVIQNAGSRVYVNGAGQDRGMVARSGDEYYETDHGQYDQMAEVFAACGGSMLLRRAMLDDVGVLDDDFFTYYEDTDLAWRARLRGWKVLYVPASVVYHVHCGTTSTGSHQFYYYVFRNRLAMLFKNAPWRSVLNEWARFGTWTLLRPFSLLASALQRRSDLRGQALQWLVQVRVCLALLNWLPRLVARRAYIQHRRTVPQSEIDRWLTPVSR